MPQIKLEIGKMNNEADTSSADDTVSAHLINGYRVGKAIKVIPGLKEFVDLGTGRPSYGYYSVTHNKFIVVSDGKAWTIERDGSKHPIHRIVLDPEYPAVFTEDTKTVYFAANSSIYSSEGPIATGNPPKYVKALGYISGFLLAGGDDASGGGLPGDIWYSSDDGYATWEVFNNEASGDKLQAILTTYHEVYAIGTDSIEVSYLSSNTDMPFAVNKSASQPFGTPAFSSVAFDQESIYYLTTVGKNRRVARLVGGRVPQIISFAVDIPIDDIEDVSNAVGFVTGFRGQTFYVITFPTANIAINDVYYRSLTLVFNTKLEEWCIWGDWNSITAEYEQYRGLNSIFVEPWGKHLVTGKDGIIYEISHDFYKFGDDNIRMALCTGWRSWNTLKRKTCFGYIYDIKRGVGNSEIANPFFQHRWRNDNNLEWSIPRDIALGRLGERSSPKQSFRCGIYYKRQDEFVFTSPCEFIINSIEENVQTK